MNLKLDPARNAASRVALVFICSVEDEVSGDKKILSVEAVEHVEPDQVVRAQTVFSKLRKLAMRLQSDPQETLKRNQSNFSTPPDSANKCRTLESQPTDASM